MIRNVKMTHRLKSVVVFAVLIFALAVSFMLPAAAVERYDCSAGRHRYSVTIREPTATTDGERVYVCDLCGHRQIRILFATQCNWSDWAIEQYPTCIRSGREYRVCTTTANHHRESRSIPALGHDFEVTAVINPTCTDVGSRTYTCRRCGNIRTETLPALGHDLEVAVTEPTCESYGIRTYTCTRCDYSRTETFGQVSGHEFIEEITTPPTYENEGVMTFTCTHCGYIYTEVIAALVADGHECEFALQSEAAPGCERDGYIIYACIYCGDSYTEIIPALGHSFGDWNISERPGLFRAGSRYMVCANSADCTIVEAIPQLVTFELNRIDAAMAFVNVGCFVLFALLMFFDMYVILWDLRKRLKRRKAKRIKVFGALYIAALVVAIVTIPLMLILLIPGVSYMNLLAFTATATIIPAGICLRRLSHRRRCALNGSRGLFKPGEQQGLLVSRNRA